MSSCTVPNQLGAICILKNEYFLVSSWRKKKVKLNLLFQMMLLLNLWSAVNLKYIFWRRKQKLICTILDTEEWKQNCAIKDLAFVKWDVFQDWNYSSCLHCLMIDLHTLQFLCSVYSRWEREGNIENCMFRRGGERCFFLIGRGIGIQWKRDGRGAYCGGGKKNYHSTWYWFIFLRKAVFNSQYSYLYLVLKLVIFDL